ncbi:ShlB/FhaC/HecB family hemolysin secretion/activation protein [Serratia sp. DD3]|uniref:ShlB/FhaC/HecB family hemolysin secretion/activation protein n=1 Tax=Serratia sp. DD3 TaxID=1410619 RepID=UPI0004D5C7A1|nr:ShlB/FhaC/HecB family hemolysin secretion/activation protein [Serratia sp. DD3]KEY57729.1 heme/hemopexin transporter protein HuxB [Serratia sp. DD3]KEY58222.1 heme/hemopexin transporter protein HuxB [Serratia sp. DD3]
MEKIKKSPLRYSPSRKTCSVLSLLLSFSSAQAATPTIPNAGQNLREIDTSRPILAPSITPELGLPAPQTSAPAESADGEQIKVKVTTFIISGNTLFSNTVLQPLLQGYTGRELTLPQLYEAVQHITLYYQQRGYVLNRAYLPEQEIENGVVKINVLEAHYGEIKTENSSRLSDATLNRLIGRMQPDGAINVGQLQQTLLLLNDTPGVQARSTLLTSKKAGAADLLVEATPAPLFSGSLDLDNYGGKYTGENRLNADVSVNSPLGLGDRLRLRGLASDDRQYYYFLSYDAPVNRWFTRVGASYSNMDYTLGKDFADLDAHGNARTTSVYVSQPLFRSRTLTVSSQLQFDDKRLRDDIELFDTQNKKNSQLWTASLTANSQDSFGGGGLNFVSASVSNGNLELADPANAQNDSQTARTAGNFSKFNLTALRLQMLSENWSFYSQFSGQLASKNLDSSEQFSLGGVNGVRAYASGEASGDQGWMTNLELRYAITPAWQLKTFFDYGGVKTNKSPWTKDKNHQQRGALGTGATWFGNQRQVSLQLAWRVNHPDDSDSQLESQPQVWLQASQGF